MGFVGCACRRECVGGVGGGSRVVCVVRVMIVECVMFAVLEGGVCIVCGVWVVCGSV